MNLREVREYYAKSTRLMTFMSLLFTLVIAGLGIYIADMASLADEADGKIYMLYTVFLVGAVLSVFQIIGCIIGRKDSYEGVLRFRRTIGFLVLVIGVISLIALAMVTKETYKEWDSYTTVIFVIDIVAAVLVIIFSVVVFLLSGRGLSYYDGKKNAKDIPDDMTIEKNNMKYKMLLGICYSVISISVFMLSYYFSKEINEYSSVYVKDCAVYEAIYDIISLVGIIVTGITFILSIVPVIINNNKIFGGTNMSYAVNSIIQFIFVVYSVVCICTKDFVKAKYPDVTYIIFAIILTLISVYIAMTAVKKSTDK